MNETIVEILRISEDFSPISFLHWSIIFICFLRLIHFSSSDSIDHFSIYVKKMLAAHQSINPLRFRATSALLIHSVNATATFTRIKPTNFHSSRSFSIINARNKPIIKRSFTEQPIINPWTSRASPRSYHASININVRISQSFQSFQSISNLNTVLVSRSFSSNAVNNDSKSSINSSTPSSNQSTNSSTNDSQSTNASNQSTTLSTAPASTAVSDVTKLPLGKRIWIKVKEEAHHYWNGTKLIIRRNQSGC